MAGRLRPGTHHSEADLARLPGISRAPLREALRQLREEGLVEPGQRGVLVAPLTQRRVSELYEVRLALEGQAAAKAATRVKEADIASMRFAMEQIGPTVNSGDVQPFLDLDIPFHDLWIQDCGNALLVQYLERLRDHIRRASNFASWLTDSVSQAWIEHIQILDALGTGDPDQARSAVESHISGVATRMLGAFPQADPTTAADTDTSLLSTSDALVK